MIYVRMRRVESEHNLSYLIYHTGLTYNTYLSGLTYCANLTYLTGLI